MILDTADLKSPLSLDINCGQNNAKMNGFEYNFFRKVDSTFDLPKMIGHDQKWL